MPQDQSVQALPHNGKSGMRHAFAPPVVAHRLGHRRRQPDAPIGLGEQWEAAVGGDIRDRELGLDAAPLGGCETSDAAVSMWPCGCPRKVELAR